MASSLARPLRASSSALKAAIRQQRSLATHAPPTAGPSSSSSSSSVASASKSWSPPIKPGVCPAYDEALAFTSNLQAHFLRQAEQIENSTEEEDGLTAEYRKSKAAGIITVGQINDPEIRWKFQNTPDDDLDLTDGTMKYFRELTWRHSGPLNKVVSRIQDMFVLPDALAAIEPTLDLQYIIGSTQGPGIGDHTIRSMRKDEGEKFAGDVLAGVLIEQKELLKQPILRLTSFRKHPSEHTVMLVDLDRPQEEGRIGSYCHWLINDIRLGNELDRLLTKGNLLEGQEALPYVPPYPGRGTSRHRYVTLVLRQHQDMTNSMPPTRQDFDLRKYIADNQLEPVGIHFYRSEWTEASQHEISRVWESQGEKEEVWGTIPRSERKRRDRSVVIPRDYQDLDPRLLDSQFEPVDGDDVGWAVDENGMPVM